MKNQANGRAQTQVLPPPVLPAGVMSAATTEPDWRTVAQMAMQQRDRMAQHANNLELDLALANAKIAKLEAATTGEAG
jgi:hypothetical protein